MGNAITTSGDKAAIIESVIAAGDLSKLTPAERTAYYMRVCESVGLNPMTRPLEYITLQGRLTLYARKDATDQLRALRRVSITKLERERIEDIYVVTAYAQAADLRTDSAIGAVSIAGLRGDALANAIMKAETKAKRRVTLSICGLGVLDETEIETIPDARPVTQPPPPKPANDNAAIERARERLNATVQTLKHTRDTSAGALALIEAAKAAWTSQDAARMDAASDAIQAHIAAQGEKGETKNEA